MSEYQPSIKSLHTLLTKRGMMDQKRDLIRELTLGRTESSRELTADELSQLVNRLSQGIQPTQPTGNIHEESRQRMIRKLYAQARECGWIEPDGKGGTKVNTQRLNHWCVTRGSGHTVPGRCTNAQLAIMVTQMERVVEDHVKMKNEK